MGEGFLGLKIVSLYRAVMYGTVYGIVSCTMRYSDDILAILSEQDKAALGLLVRSDYYSLYNQTTGAAWISKQPGNVSRRDWLLTRLRKAKPFALGATLYLDPSGTSVWFNMESCRVEAFLEAMVDPPEIDPEAPGTPTPVPWFKTPNGKRYLDEWRNGRLQHGAYVFADAGATVRLLDPTKPQLGDPIPGDVLCYIHSPCALMVQVNPGLLRAPSGIADIVATAG